MKICAVIVTWNRYETLVDTLTHLSRQSILPDYTVVVDNGYTAAPDAIIRSFQKLTISYLPLSENLGYARGLSEGMGFALNHFSDLDFFLLMDDDSQPGAEYIELMLQARMKCDKPGIICSIGLVDYVWSGPIIIFNYKHRENRIISADPRVYRVDHVLVDGAFVDKVVVDRVGRPRADFFMMCEDVEYSKRIKRAGFAVLVLDNDRIIKRLHMGGGKQFSASTRWRGYYHARNHLIILKEYFSLSALASYVIRQLKFLTMGILAPDRFQRVGLRLLGIYHGIRGIMGKTIEPADFAEEK